MGLFQNSDKTKEDKNIMRKAVLANRIFLNPTPAEIAEYEEKLTHKIPPKLPMEPPTYIKNLRKIRRDLVSIPIGREDLIPEDMEIVEKRVAPKVDFPDMLYKLREDQEEVYNAVNDNCLINALVGWGKTFTSLAIAKKLGVKTLVIVNTKSLATQWVHEVEKMFGFVPDITTGGSLKMSTPIVIGNTQTLMNFVPEIKREFGLLLVDEVHHLPAKTFETLVDTSYARYKIGLSGTLKRKDGKHIIFPDYFGTNVIRPSTKNTLTPQIVRFSTDHVFPDGKMPWAKRVNKLAYDPEYQNTIAFIASAFAQKGHKVLVVSDRTELLENVTELIGEKAVCVTGSVKDVKERNKREQRLYKDVDILNGAINIYKEGISIECLSCLILAVQINNEPMLEQLIGRIIRKEEGKLMPVVVDVLVKGNTAKRQAEQRLGYYIQQGYKITNM